MTFEKLIEQFVNHVEEEKNGLTSVTYKRKIYVFYEYVVLELQAKDVNYQSILTGMKVKELLDALEYYVRNYDVKYATTAWNYISSLACKIILLYGTKNNVTQLSQQTFPNKA